MRRANREDMAGAGLGLEDQESVSGAVTARSLLLLILETEPWAERRGGFGRASRASRYREAARDVSSPSTVETTRIQSKAIARWAPYPRAHRRPNSTNG